MEQKAHVLGHTRARAFPRLFFFLDTETFQTNIGHKTKVHNLKMGVCQHYERMGEYGLVFQDELMIERKAQFMSWLQARLYNKRHYYLIAHNVIYDATILDLFRELPKIGFTLQSRYSKGQVCILRWVRGSTKITMLDNGNIFGGTLEKWGKILNIPKLSIDFNTCTRTELEIYCRRDVEIMVKSWQTWMEFISVNQCGGFRETLGSTAFNAWRAKYLRSPVYVHKDPDVLKLERAAYHGGRVEAFQQGRLEGDHYYYLDINNMYGYIMQSNLFPVGLQDHSTKPGISRLITYLERYAVTARVTVNTDEPVYITKHNNHTCYPLGRFETVLTTHELRYALERGHLERLHEMAWYKQSDLFAGFVTDFYSLRLQYRQAHNQGFETICKMLINSLYGKFGQTGIEQTQIGICQPDEVWYMPVIHAQTGQRGSQTALGGVIMEEWQQGESYHALPVIAAHVTANARLYLWSLIQTAGRHNVYYCDTDSLIVNTQGYYNLEHLIEPDVLGKLKIETHSTYLIVNAPKDYEMSERRKVKGIRSNAVQLNENTFLQEQWIKLAGLIRSGFEQGYTSKEIIKHQQRIIHSGVVTWTGRVQPFELR
jgi:DNA polymerase elongation subunit (family B)